MKQPWYMDESGFKRYLRENGKTVLRRILVTLPKPDAARAKMEELMSKRWLWFAIWHNCATFVEQILAAGGSSRLTSYANCPELGWR